MGRIRTDVHEKFTIVHNDYLRNPTLGYAEIGMLTVMLSLPENWSYSIDGLLHRFGKGAKSPDGKFKIQKALKNLETAGYFSRIRETDAKGRITGYSYIFSDEHGEIKTDYSKNFTVLSNEYLRDQNMGIEEIGLLTVLLSLPDNWDFSIEGLTYRFGKDIKLPDGEFKNRSLLKKLNRKGYFRRIRLIDEKGKVIDWIYEFSDTVQENWLNGKSTVTEKFVSDFSPAEKNVKAETAPETKAAASPETANTDIITEKIKGNIDYDKLCEKYSARAVDALVRILSEAVRSGKSYRVNRQKFTPKEIRELVYKVSGDTASQIIENLRNVKNVRYPIPYILTSVYNSLFAETGTNSHSFFNLREIFSDKSESDNIENNGDPIMEFIRNKINAGTANMEVSELCRT